MNPFYHPKLLPTLFPNLVWRVPGAQENTCYLSFDDGPHPEITPRIIDWLDKKGYKATFFCIGENVLRYPKTFEMLHATGMQIGNHTMSHLNGWKHNTQFYLNDVAKADACMGSPDLFRPPFGRITLKQMRKIESNKTIVMWTMVTGDWKKDLNILSVLDYLKKRTVPGFIPVFHDSEKAWPQLQKMLPSYLDYLYQNNWHSDGITTMNIHT